MVLQALSPDKQFVWCDDERLCLLGNFPTLTELNITYNPNAAVVWLIPQLVDLSEYCGCKDKLNKMQLQHCAQIITSKWHYMKVSEFMLFFYRFKQGRYGRFYGSIDPMVITTALNDFVSERNNALDMYEKELRNKKLIEEYSKSITYDEWKEIKKSMICDDISPC